MNGVQINGRPAIASGSVMIPPGVIAAVAVPGGTMTLQFRTEGEEGYRWDHWTLTITAKDNPLGIALQVPLAGSDGTPLTLALTVHTVGQGATAYRIVHFTAYAV